MAMPGLGMWAHCPSDSLTPKRGQEFLCMFVIREMPSPQGISKPHLELEQSLVILTEKEDLLEWVSLGVKYEEMYSLQERTNDLVWLVVYNTRDPSVGRRIRLTDTILTTFLVEDWTGCLGAAESLLREITALQGMCTWGPTFAWGEKHYRASPASPQTR